MITRRDFFRACLLGSTLFSFNKIFAASDIGKAYAAADFEGEVERIPSGEKILSMYNVHTCERLNIQYCSAGKYDLEALERINYFLRCHYTNEVKEMDIGLLDLLCDIRQKAGKPGEVQIISGYRSPDYNEKLISLGRNVSIKSLHLHGLAIDFAIEGLSSERLSQIARSFVAGGVGKYREFVHIDVGRVRYW